MLCQLQVLILYKQRRKKGEAEADEAEEEANDEMLQNVLRFQNDQARKEARNVQASALLAGAGASAASQQPAAMPNAPSEVMDPATAKANADAKAAARLARERQALSIS